MTTSRYVAFLRAINVGGRTVKMHELRLIFEQLGFDNVATFIASGNVVFETAETAVHVLERRIEKQLRTALGYEVATFVRLAASLAAIASYPTTGLGAADGTTYVIFLRGPLDKRKTRDLLAMKTADDDLRVNGSEVFWQCRVPSRDSTISGARIEKLLESPVTVRNLNTVTRMATKYGPAD